MEFAAAILSGTAWQAARKHGQQFLPPLRWCFEMAPAGRRGDFRIDLLFSAGPLKQMDVENRKIDRIEAQRLGSAFKPCVQPGPNPIEQWHHGEVDTAYARLRQPPYCLLKIGGQPRSTLAAQLDVVVNGDAAERIPFERCVPGGSRLDKFLQLVDSICLPQASRGQLGQAGFDAGRTRLAYPVDRHWILWTEPPPCCAH